MRNCPIFMLMALVALFLTAAHAVAQPDSEKARVESLLANEATAGEKLRAYDRLHQKLADVLAQRAHSLEKEGKKEESGTAVRHANAELLLVRQAYETALKRYPGHAELHNYYGELLFDRFDEQKEGVAEWKKAIALDEKLGRAYNNLGIYLCHEGGYAEGLGDLDKAVLLEPDNPDYLYNIAQIYLSNWPQVMTIRKWTPDELYKAAMAASASAARYAPTDFDLVVDYARNFFMAEQIGVAPDWEGAAKAWQTARILVRNDEEKFNTWLNEARVWYKAGKGAKAVKCCDEALTIRPQSVAAKELMKMSEQPIKPKAGK